MCARVFIVNWFELLFPSLIHPNTETAVVDNLLKILDTALSVKAKGATGKVHVSVNGLVAFIILRHSKNTPKKLDRIASVYDSVLDTLVFDHLTSPRRCFLAFLPFAQASENIDERLRFTFLSLLTRSLAQDTQCLKLLKGAYVKHIPSTNNLIKHIADNWNGKGKGGIPTQNKPKSQLYKAVVDLLKWTVDENTKLLAGQYCPEGENQPYSLKRLGVPKTDVQACTLACYEAEKVLTKAAPPPAEDSEEGNEGVGKMRYFLIFLLLVVIYFVWAHNIQFGDIKHFIHDYKVKLGL